MSQESLYVRRTPGYSSKLFNQVPETVKAFSEFNKLALASGALTVRQKELVAIGIAHVTGCPYCIEAHVHKAKAEEAALEELIEAILVAAAVQSHAVFAHGANAAVAYEGGVRRRWRRSVSVQQCGAQRSNWPQMPQKPTR